MERARISTGQLTILVAHFLEKAFVLYMIGPMTELAGPDAWLAILVGLLLGFGPIALMLGAIARHYPGKSFSEMAEAALGRWPGKLATFVMGGYALYLTSLVVRNITDFTALSVLQETPPMAIGILFVALMSYAVYCGIEVIARLSVLIYIVVIMAAILIPVSLVKDFLPLRILPVLGDGLGPVLTGAWPTLGWFGEGVLFLALLGLLDRPKRSTWALLKGALMAYAVIASLTVSSIMMFGHHLVSRLNYASYSLVQEIAIGEFMTRVEIGLIAVWISGMLIKSTVALWVATTSLSGMLGLKTDRKLIVPIAAGALGLTLLWPGSPLLRWYGANRYTETVLPLQFALPMLLLAGTWIKRLLRGAASA